MSIPQTADDVAEWLTKLGYTDVVPMSLQVAKSTYYGCAYTFTGTYTHGMMAVLRGDKRAGDTYTQPRFYFVGERPSCDKRRKVCFTFEGKTYYVSSYHDRKTVTEYSPWGLAFMLGIWPTEEYGEIDRYEPKPYERVPIVLTPLTKEEKADEVPRHQSEL